MTAAGPATRAHDVAVVPTTHLYTGAVAGSS
jgi:hypothetical protein